jgi:hypothetical protein
MKYAIINITMAVPDNFDWEDGSVEAEWIDMATNLEGLCDYEGPEGCTIEHFASAHLLTEEQYNAQYEDE